MALLAAAFPIGLHAETLYELETTCSLEGADPIPCRVLAREGETSTRYEHHLHTDAPPVTIRISDDPVVRMERLGDDGETWTSLRQAAARLSTNTICFEGRELCVVNPNYLNSVREERGAALDGRDLVLMRFGDDGRVNASCLDEGCRGIAP
jgi:hypothetical protein